MPWSVGFNAGPFRYSQPVRRHGGDPALLTAVKVLAGFVAVALVLVALVLFGLVIAAAWICGFFADVFCLGRRRRSTRYATAVLDWGYNLVGHDAKM